jgi:hypothetical protein
VLERVVQSQAKQLVRKHPGEDDAQRAASPPKRSTRTCTDCG